MQQCQASRTDSESSGNAMTITHTHNATKQTTSKQLNSERVLKTAHATSRLTKTSNKKYSKNAWNWHRTAPGGVIDNANLATHEH